MNKYSLELGMTTLASPETMPLYDDIWARTDKLTLPGGSALNSARASKHANRSGCSVAYFGCIADDSEGQTLERSCQEAGIECYLEKTTEEPTGKLALTPSQGPGFGSGVIASP